MMGMEDGIVYLVVGEVLASYVQTELAKFSRHLSLQLEVGGITAAIVQFAVTVELTCYVKLPKLEGRLV